MTDPDCSSFEPEVHIVEGPSDPYEYFLEWEYFAEVLVTDESEDFLETARKLAQNVIQAHDSPASSSPVSSGPASSGPASSGPASSGPSAGGAGELGGEQPGHSTEVQSTSKGASHKTGTKRKEERAGPTCVSEASSGQTNPTSTKQNEASGAESSSSDEETPEPTTQDKFKKSKILELNEDEAATLATERQPWPPDYVINNENLAPQVAAAAEQSSYYPVVVMESDSEGNKPLSSDFIPLPQLSLENLPKDIRTEQNLELIRSVARRVVRIRLPQTSEDRRADDPLCDHILYATGVVVMVLGNVAVVATSKHALQDAEEVRASSIDFFFDSETEWYKTISCTTGIGTLDMWKYNDDTTLALYLLKDQAAAILSEPGFHGLQSPGLSWPPHASPDYAQAKEMQSLGASFAKPSEGSHTVCVVSHPLGRAKHVTFGSVVSSEDAHEKELYHNAPSRYGCAGAPLLVFAHIQIAYDSVWYHLGQSLDGNGLKVARVQKINLQSMLEELQNPHKARAEGGRRARAFPNIFSAGGSFNPFARGPFGAGFF